MPGQIDPWTGLPTAGSFEQAQVWTTNGSYPGKPGPHTYRCTNLTLRSSTEELENHVLRYQLGVNLVVTQYI
ncbi:hypothetical protein ACFLS1_10055, partial [Verrucomicrobiota bacterium]